MYSVRWNPSALDDIDAFFDYLVEQQQCTPRYAHGLCDRLLGSTEHLARFPRLYEAAPKYGEGVRKIGVLGHFVLYEIDDDRELVTVLSVALHPHPPTPTARSASPA